MKIGLVTQSYYPACGGVTEHVHALYRGLTELGHEVKVITSSFGVNEASTNEDVIRVGRNIRVLSNGAFGNACIGASLSRRIRDVLDTEAFDLLHIHEPLVPTLPLLALHHSRTITVGSFHSFHPDCWFYRHGRKALHRLFAKLHGRIAGSEASARAIGKHFPGEYTVIPYGIDLSRFESDRAVPFSNGPNGLNVLFVGRLDPRKGLRYLLEAFNIVGRSLPGAHLNVVGSGPMMLYYRALAAKLRLNGAVTFFGTVPPKNLPSFYSQSQVFCSPAIGGESFGIVLLEAMAAGLPIVATNISGYRDVVSEGENALLVEPRNVEALASSILFVLQNRSLRNRMARINRGTSRCYSYQAMTAKIEAYYTRTVAETIEANVQ